MGRTNTSLLILVIFCATFIDGASISKPRRNHTRIINMRNSTIRRVYITNYFNTSVSLGGADNSRKIERHLKRIEASANISREKLHRLVGLVNVTEKDVKQIRKLQNLTSASYDRIERIALEILKKSKLDGRWSQWSEWSDCSVTCDDGISTRTRICLVPINGGKQCEGKKTESRSCNNKCAVDGRWSEWSEWSNCSATCGDGTATRTRTCLEPINGGKPCDGNKTESKTCNNECPEDAPKVIVAFWSWHFKVKPPYVKQSGDYPTSRDYIIADIPALTNITNPSFEQFKAGMSSIVNADAIKVVMQRIGYVNGKQVVQVTSKYDEVRGEKSKWEFCDSKGNVFSYRRAREPHFTRFYKTSTERLMLSGGGRRTVFEIMATI